MAFSSATIFKPGSSAPYIEFGGATTGITYGTQTLEWEVLPGDLVHINLRIILTSKGSATGAAVIRALPYTAKSGYNHPVNIAYASLASGVGDANVLSYIPASLSRIDLWKSNGSGSIVALTDADFSATTALNISGIYKTS